MAANEARERGNALYRQRKLGEAEKAYLEAMNLEPENPAPISNMSAVRFEMGKYADAAEFAVKALALSADQPDTMKDRLKVRLAKSYFYGLDMDAAGKVVGDLGSEQEALVDAIRDTAHLRTSNGMMPSPASWMRLFDRIPRYKPCLQDEPEYFAFGHDEAEPLFTIPDAKTGNPNQELSYLFCGSGDARHVFSTMMTASFYGGRKAYKSIHFTLLDIKAPALARTLIMFELLMEYCILKARDPSEDTGNMVLLAMSYIYAGQILPPLVYEKLQEIIERLIMGLKEDTEEPLFPWLFVESSSKTQILRHLRHWQQPPTGKFRTENVRKAVVENIQSLRERHTMMFGEDSSRPDDMPGTTQDSDLFDEFAFIPPPKRYMAKFEPELLKILSRHLDETDGAADALQQYLDENWKSNITAFDMDWDATRHIPVGTKATRDIATLNSNPFHLAKDITMPMGGHHMFDKDNLIEVLNGVFSFLGRASIELQYAGHMTMEIIVTEMSDFMERLRYDALPHRKLGASGKGLNPSSFPRTFDRIHLSNIPDYVGGLISSHLYAPPLLRDTSSNLRFNILLNPVLFDSHDHFSAEYLLMPDAQIPRHFGIRPSKRQEYIINGQFWITPMYWIWRKVGVERLRGPGLLTRPKLEHGLYAHFLKLVLPFPRPHMSNLPVVAPLNITMLIRLVIRMHEVGYPAHWLAAVLEALCSGKIVTTARAPRMLVTDLPSAVTAYQEREMDVTPWAADFTTALSIWRGLLPFGIAAPKGTLVSLGEVDEYCIRFKQFITGKARQFPHFALVFWGKEAGEPPADLREALLDDEAGSPVKDGVKQNVHVVTTFKFVAADMEASFWMRRDVAEKMVNENGWRAWVWRTDTWERETDATDVSGGMVKKRNWLDE